MADDLDLAVIGAGVHGLVVAKTYLQVHPDASVALFDNAASIGGVWSKERLYPGLKTNNLLGGYEFSDFPLTGFGVREGQHIPGIVVHDYLTKFADHFDLKERIFLNTTVSQAVYRGADGWTLKLQESAAQREVSARRLVVATGLESRPAIPSLPGMEVFGKPLFHTKEWAKEKDKLESAEVIAVLGGSKSAADVANYYAGRGVKVHWIIRKSGSGPGWTSPAWLTGFNIRLEKLIAVRFLAFFSPCIWAADGYTWIPNLLHGTRVGNMIVKLFYADMQRDICNKIGYEKHPETKKLQPWNPIFWHDADVSILNYDNDLLGLVRKDQIQVHIADVDQFSAGNVHLSDGSSVEADAFVCATGWNFKPNVPFVGISDEQLGLPLEKKAPSTAALAQKADIEIYVKYPMLQHPPKGNTERSDLRGVTKAPAEPYRLYRFIVPPSLVKNRNIAFAGAQHNVITCLVAQTQALWITAYFDDELDSLYLPSDGAAKLQEELDRIRYETFLHTQFSKRRSPFGFSSRHPAFGTDSLAYVDLLLKDLGLRVRRKGNWLRELFSPYMAKDWAGLVDEWLLSTQKAGKML